MITFGQPLPESSPELLPPSFWSFFAAPFWTQISTNESGRVSWEIHDGSTSPDLLEMVNNLIQQEQRDTTFSSLWMLVGFWEDVQFIDQPGLVCS